MGSCNILCCDGTRNKEEDNLPLDEQPKYTKLRKQFAEDYPPSESQTEAGQTTDAEVLKEQNMEHRRQLTEALTVQSSAMNESNQINSSTRHPMQLVEESGEQDGALEDSGQQDGLVLDSLVQSELTEIEAGSDEKAVVLLRADQSGDEAMVETAGKQDLFIVDENGQGTEEENEILRQQATDTCLIRWYRKDDYQQGYLQLISLEPLQQLHERCCTPNLMKPYGNKDELVKDFEELFPKRKNEVKIIVAEVEDRIVFALQLFIQTQKSIQKKTDGEKVGHIYDLMMNRNCYGQLENPQDILKRMVAALENIGWMNECTEMRVQANITEKQILQDLKYTEADGEEVAFMTKSANN